MEIRIIRREIKKVMNHKYLFFILISILGFSCSSRETYFNFYELKDNEWNKYDTLVFEIDSSLIDLNKHYDLYIECINNTEYLYQNLWLYTFDNLKNENYQKTERQFLLADSIGKWYGNGFGSLYELALPYKLNFSFPEKRTYRFKIIHGMIDNPLLGIEKIGLRLSDAETN